MKKSAVLKKFENEPDILNFIAPLERHKLYYISRNLTFNDGKVPALLTHFYTHGIRFKILIKSPMSHDGFYNIGYERYKAFTLTPMPLEDLPLFAYAANQHTSEGFLKGAKHDVGV